MAAASGSAGSVICHELYVTDASELFMVFMAHAA